MGRATPAGLRKRVHSGTAFEMLKAIDMVGNDLDLTRSLTAPTFRIKLMQIGGD